MKRILFFMILSLGLLSCKGTDEITLPDKNIKVENDVLLYKEKPYSGKIKVNLMDKIQGYEGFLNFKEGHLDGLTELKNDKKKQHIKFTIVNGKFDGDVIMNDPEQLVKMQLSVNKGSITKMVADVENSTKYDITFNKGLANGTMEAGGQKLNFKDGMGKLSSPQGDLDLKLSIDEATGDMTVESSINGTSLGKNKIPNQLTPQYLEKFLFTDILMDSNK